MAEPQKETSSVIPEKKKSLLDDDIKNEFLSSWKTMSVTEDDTMDFNFSTVSSGKKKAFDFEKLDMDFNLDGDFNKLSSFKVDITDFDFSSPSTKVVKTKEKSEQESSTGNQKGKKKQFDFSFDFNDLDSFDFDSSLMKEEKASHKSQDGKKESSLDGDESRGSKSQLSESVKAFDTVATKLQPFEDVRSSKVESMAGHLTSIKNDSVKHVISEAAILSHCAEPSPEKVIANDKEISSELFSEKAIIDFPSQSLEDINSNRYALCDGKNESCEQSSGLPAISNQKDVTEKLMAVVLSCDENLPLKDSLTQQNTTLESNNGETNTSDSKISKEIADCIVSSEADVKFEEKSTSFVSRKDQPDVKDNKEKQNLTTERPIVLPCREGLNSNDARTGIELCGNSLLVAREFTKGKDAMQEGAKNDTNLTDIRESFVSNGIPNESKLVGKSHDGEATKVEPVWPASDKIGKGQNTLGLQDCPSISSEKQIGSSNQISVNSKAFSSNMAALRDPKIKLAEETTLCPAKACRKLPDLSTLKISKYWMSGANQVSSNSLPQKDISCLQNPEKNVQVQGNTANTASEAAPLVVSTEKKLPLNFSLKRKSFELSHSDLASLKPLKRLSTSLIESRDFKEPLKRLVEEKFSTAEKSSISDAGKSLKPLKFLSESFGGSRNLKEPLKRIDVKESVKSVGEDKANFHENHVESTPRGSLYNSPAYALEISPKVNVIELEISSIMEKDGNVERAEALTKELEEICNMLKKKHDEAKEILVRAVVNNNNLLMLNHPLYEEKISFRLTFNCSNVDIGFLFEFIK
ncbi:uncharacterized protein At4g18490 [Humulus lupulus]|uniref:uncharacterized protein At4g18490 n=1 Tax=Humulus lupulus TaxID=3486 RepID=UPI002B40A6BC|nr:uncharacterized protein At4g18490 [Humulus lupulus]